jgi:hypothetical protein
VVRRVLVRRLLWSVGFLLCTALAVWAQNYCGGIVELSSTVPSSSFLQLGLNGTILNSYTAPSGSPRSAGSIWVRSVFQTFESYISAADLNAAAISDVEDYGLYVDPSINGCGCSGSCTSNGSNFNLSTWESGCFPFSSYLSFWNTNHIPIFQWWQNVDSGIQINNGAWGAAPLQYAANYIKNNAPAGMFLADMGIDEIQSDLTGTGWAGVIANEALDGHAQGPEPFANNASIVEDWLGSTQALTSTQFGIVETVNNLHSSSGGSHSDPNFTTSVMLGLFEASDSRRATAIADRTTAMPYILTGFCNGVGYYKGSGSGSQNFDPAGGDVEFNPHTGITPGQVVAQIFYAVAHGYVGFRSYTWDPPAAVSARHNTGLVCSNPSDGLDLGCFAEQTGCGSVGDFTRHGSIGQDRWYAISAAYNVIHSIEPEVLQPAMTAPGSCDSTGSGTGDPIICGAKQGTVGGTTYRVVTIINFSDSNTTYSFNPSAYYFGAGTTANAYQIIGANNANNTQILGTGSPYCGAESTDASVTDCYNGATTINGTTWNSSSSSLPAAGSAPTTTTNIGACSGQMCPLEVD